MKIEITKHIMTNAEMKDVVKYDLLIMDSDTASLAQLQAIRDYIDAYVAREEKSTH